MATATMDLYTILDTTKEMGHFGQLLALKCPTPAENTEEDDAPGFEVCIRSAGPSPGQIPGEALTADRFKDIVFETIEEMILE